MALNVLGIRHDKKMHVEIRQIRAQNRSVIVRATRPPLWGGLSCTPEVGFILSGSKRQNSYAQLL